MTDVLTVSDLGSALLARWRLVVSVTLVMGLAGLTYGLLTPNVYTAKAVLIVMAAPASQDGYYQAAQFSEKRAATYPALVGSPGVLDPTLDKLGLDMSEAALRRMVTATNPTDTPLVEVSAESTDATLARDIADSTADNLATYAIDLEKNGSRITTVSIQKAVPASEPIAPSSPSPVTLLALGLLVGAALGAIGALLLRTWRGPVVRPGRAPVARGDEVDDAAPAERVAEGPPAEPVQADAPAPVTVASTGPDDDTHEGASPAEPAATVQAPPPHGLRAVDPRSGPDSPNGRRRGPRGARRPVTTAGTAYASPGEDASQGPRRRAGVFGRILDDDHHVARGG